MPLLSIIVPVYNVENYLHECVDSILSQTFTDYELILVDDGSTDNSGAICDKYAEQDSRIIVVHKHNSGQADSRNVALLMANGKYITFIDSDDFYASKETLSNINLLLNDKQISFVQFPVAKSLAKADNGRDGGWKEGRVIDSIEAWNLWLTPPAKIVTNYLCDKIFRADVFYGLSLPKGLIFEDRYIFSSILRKCDSILISESGLYYYRTHSQQTTHQKETPYFIKCQILADTHTLHNIPSTLCLPIAYLYWNIVYNYTKFRKLSDEAISIPLDKLKNVLFLRIPIGIRLNLMLIKLIGIERYVKFKSR